jgi:hypothetical protein
LNLFNTNLLKLNNVKLNYFILIFIIILLSFLYNKLLNYSLNIYLYFFLKKTKFYFIKKFYLGFFKIHPIIFYFTLVYYLVSLYKNKIYCKIKHNFLLYVGITSFTLGGYWNMFHLQSGRFWSNDSIEILLVFLIYIYIAVTHKIRNGVKIKCLNLFRFIVLLLFIRFNFIYTKHNFFNLNKKNLKILIYTYIVLPCSIMFINKKQKVKFFLQNKTLQFTTLLWIMFIILFNYVNFLKLKTYNKFIIYLIWLMVNLNIDWVYYKNKIMHLIMFLSVTLYFVFSTKYVYILQTGNINKQILLTKNLNNYLHNLISHYKSFFNFKKYLFYFNNENFIIRRNKLKILIN